MIDFQYEKVGKDKDILAVVITGILDESTCHYLMECVEEEVLEGRKKLILDPSDRRSVARNLAAIGSVPDAFDNDVMVSLALRSALKRLVHDGGAKAVTEVIDLLREVGDDVSTVLVIGHNPTMSDVSILLRPDDEDPGWEGLKTAGLAVHTTNRPWSETEPGAMALQRRHTARG